MAKLIYTAISSLDGYVADAEGNFDWSAPDDEVHRFVNELERPIGTYLIPLPHRGGRRQGVTRSPKEHCPTIGATQYPAEDDGQHDHDGGHRGIAYGSRIRGHGHGEQRPAGREKEAHNRQEP